MFFSKLKCENRRQNGTQNIRASLEEKAKGNWLAGMAQLMGDPSSNQAKKIINEGISTDEIFRMYESNNER